LTNAVLVPTAAIQRNGTQAFVYVLSGDTVKMRTVSELSTEDNVAAVTGIKAGEVVSTSSFDKLQDGAKVTVQNAGTTGADTKAGKTP
jgi:multidrug efflux system membrane fusion protein